MELNNAKYFPMSRLSICWSRAKSKGHTVRKSIMTILPDRILFSRLKESRGNLRLCWIWWIWLVVRDWVMRRITRKLATSIKVYSCFPMSFTDSPVGRKSKLFYILSVHIPYRDSKLTRLLAPSLSGQSLTIVICTVSPASVNFYQTLSTLRFAACSRKVELKPFSNSP